MTAVPQDSILGQILFSTTSINDPLTHMNKAQMQMMQLFVKLAQILTNWCGESTSARSNTNYKSALGDRVSKKLSAASVG